MTLCYHDPQIRWARLADCYGTQTRRYPRGRMCADPGCRTVLSAYNPGSLCYACTESLHRRAAASSDDAVADETAPPPCPSIPSKPLKPLRHPRGNDGVTRERVLEMLPVGVVVSGRHVGRKLGISGNAVYKHVCNLRRCGHVIESRGGACGGYRRLS